MTQNFLIHDGQSEQGPFSGGQLVEMSRDGRLQPDHKVRQKSSTKWIKAKKVRGLKFPENDEQIRLRTAFRALLKEVTEVFLWRKEDAHRLELASRYLEEHCCDERVVMSILCEDVGEVCATAKIALGHDILYWAIIAILADGEVQQEELESVELLVKEIAEAYAEKIPHYSEFANLEYSSIEKFLATFKKDRSHYGWPSAQDASEISADAFLAAPIVIAAVICDPTSNCLRTYRHLIEATVSVIVMVDGLTPTEEAIVARMNRFLAVLESNAVKAEDASRTAVSPLLQMPNELKQPVKISNSNPDFRKVTWGMTRSEVFATEDCELVLDSEQALFFEGTVADLPANIIYVFAAGICIRAKYLVTKEHSNLNRHISDYGSLRELLVRKYGRVRGKDDEYSDILWLNDLYQDDFDEWGFAVSIGHAFLSAEWENERSKVGLVLSGDNYDIGLHVEYESKELAHLEDQIKETRHLDEL